MRRGCFAGGMLIAAVIASACSGDDDGASDAAASAPAATSGSAPVPTAPSTTGPAVVDTTAVTTSTSVVVTAPTTSPPTSSGPPPPTDPPEPTLEELEAQVAAAYEVIYDGYWACLRSPLDCDTSWLVEGSGSAEAMQATMQGLADRDRYVGDDDVGYYVIEDIQFNDDGTEATVTSCWWSTAVLLGSPRDPDQPPGQANPPTVVNDTPSSGRQLDRLTRVGESWLSASGRLLDDGASTNVCEES